MAVIFSSLLIDTIFVSVILAVLYWLATRNFNYWQKRGVRYISQWPFIGSLPSILLLRDNLSTGLHKLYDQMAGEPYFGLTFLGVPLFVVRDLDLVKAVLVKDVQVFLDRTMSIQEDADPLMAKGLGILKGRKWRFVRMKLTPTFTSGKMRKMFYLVDECGKQLARCLKKEASSDGVVDVRDCMGRYGADVIASCAFGINANVMADPNSEFWSVFKNVAVFETLGRQLVASLAFTTPALTKMFRLKFFAENVNEFFRKLFWSVVEERKKTGEVRKDFVELLMKLKDENQSGIEDTKDIREIDQENVAMKISNNIQLEDDDIVAQAFLFLLAGFEGPATVLTFTLYELAQNPDIQKKLRSVITTVLSKHGNEMSYDAIVDMPYLDMVVSESLRKYPPTGFLERKCRSDYKLPGTELIIEKDTTVMISVAGIHFDPEIYPDPQKYDPERFSAENKLKRSQYAYLPFGEGPRNCIGMRFALMQVKTALVHILTSHEVNTCSETPKPPLSFKVNTLGLQPKERIRLEFKKY